MRSLLFLAMALLAACTPTPAPSPPAPDAGDGGIDAAPAPVTDACAALCANLAGIGCSDGSDPDCAAVCRHVSSTHIIALDVACGTAAKNKSGARACVGVKCP